MKKATLLLVIGIFFLSCEKEECVVDYKNKSTDTTFINLILNINGNVLSLPGDDNYGEVFYFTKQ
tara:strand:- start:247 stop:441 length:195 start_codon:yes stop_codon:yes gene_type:complete